MARAASKCYSLARRRYVRGATLYVFHANVYCTYLTFAPRQLIFHAVFQGRFMLTLVGNRDALEDRFTVVGDDPAGVPV